MLHVVAVFSNHFLCRNAPALVEPAQKVSSELVRDRAGRSLVRPCQAAGGLIEPLALWRQGNRHGIEGSHFADGSRVEWMQVAHDEQRM